jgi:hypothetical protein
MQRSAASKFKAKVEVLFLRAIALVLAFLGLDTRKVDERKTNALFESIDTNAIGGSFVIQILRDGPMGPRVIDEAITSNLVVNTGKRQLWRMASGLNTNDWDQMRIGTSAVAANSGQTNVITPVTGTINTVDQKTLLSGTRTFQLMISYPSGGGTKSATNIREVVVLNQNTSPGGSALARATFSAVNKTTADKLKILYRFRVT